MFYTDENRSLWNPYRQAADTKDPYTEFSEPCYLNPKEGVIVDPNSLHHGAKSQKIMVQG